MITTLRKIFLALTFLGIATPYASAAATCSVSVSGLAFGSHDPISGSPTDSTGTVSVTCAGTVGDSASYSILLGSGGGSYSNRQMSSGSNVMYYNIFTESGHYSIFGDGTGSTATLSNSLTLVAPSQTTNHAIYGRIYAGQTSVPAGSYGDTLVVTLQY